MYNYFRSKARVGGGIGPPRLAESSARRADNKMIYTTYVLINKSEIKTYVGHTNNLEKRLDQHNQGKGTFSRRYRPWKILHKENFLNEIDSVKREKYFKSAAGRRWMKKNLFNN